MELFKEAKTEPLQSPPQAAQATRAHGPELRPSRHQRHVRRICWFVVAVLASTLAITLLLGALVYGIARLAARNNANKPIAYVSSPCGRLHRDGGGQEANASTEFQNYLSEITRASSVRVAAMHTPMANTKVNLCGLVIPSRAAVADTVERENLSLAFQIDGGFMFNFLQGEQRHAVLTQGRGFVWTTLDDDVYDDSEASVQTRCVYPSEVPPLGSLLDAAASATWDESRSSTNDRNCERKMRLTFAGEQYFVSRIDNGTSDFGAACLGVNSDPLVDGRQSSSMFRVESGDIVMHLKPQTRNSEDDEAIRIALELVDVFDSSYDFSLCPRLPTTIRLRRSEREDAEQEGLSAVDGGGDELDTESQSLNTDAMPLLPLRGWWNSGKKMTYSEHLKSQAAGKNASAKSTCTCTNGANKKCLFIHGIGVHDNVGVQDDFAEYWGSQVKTALPCCSVVKFTHFNTVDPPWHSRAFAREICTVAAAVAENASYNASTGVHKRNESSSKPVVLRDVVLIAHSMGNLHLASALHYGDCALDPKSSRWLAIQGPMSGSHTANRVIEECREPNTTWDDLTRRVLEGFALCPVTGSTQSLVLRGSNGSASRLDTLYEKVADTFRASVYGSMCGVSAVGILSPSSPRYVALEAFSNHSSRANDGAVEFASCRGGINATLFAPKPTSRFYKAEINHDDGRMINGDSTWAETRKPLKWLQCQF